MSCGARARRSLPISRPAGSLSLPNGAASAAASFTPDKAGIYVFGLLVEAGFQRGAARLMNALVQRIPVVRTVYDVVQKLVQLFARKDDDGLKSMSPVWLYFGGKGKEQGTVVLGLLSTPQPVMLNGQPYMGVLVPTAPVPVGGGLLYVPPEWVEPADIGMEAVTSIYVSMGVTSGQYLKG